MQLKEFFDPQTSTFTYVISNEITNAALVIDPVLDYNAETNSTENNSINDVIAYLKSNQLNVKYILETHVHADHLSASQVLKEKFPEASIAINKNIAEVQKLLAQNLNLADQLGADGRQFDLLLSDGQILSLDDVIQVTVLFTPGHTPACTTFSIGKYLFVGDALFMPDIGCGRCDFPGGSAEELYNSIQKIYDFPEDYLTCTGHDYPPEGRALKYSSTVLEQKTSNKAINQTTTKEDFIKFRTTKDAGLNEPKLITPSLKVNLNAGFTDYL